MKKVLLAFVVFIGLLGLLPAEESILRPMDGLHYTESHTSTECFGSEIRAKTVSSDDVSTADACLNSATSTCIESIYPNPFNNRTTISFNLTREGSSSFKIYNLKGQLVKNMPADEHYPAGNHKLLWDGTNDHGKVVSSRVYVCRMNFEGEFTIRRMLLLK